MTGRTILVTGAAGFLGGHVLAALRSHAGRVVGTVRRDAQATKVTMLGAEPVFADVTEPTSLVEAMAGVDAIIHLAAVSRDRDDLAMEMVNYRGTVNVLAAALAARVSRLVQVVGIGADSRRAFPLSRTQGLAADAFLRSGIPATVLEAGVIFGRGDAFVTMLAGMARLLPIVVVPGSGQERFEPISAIDVAAAAIKVLDMPGTVGQRYQIAGPEIMTLDHVYDVVLRTLRLKRPKLHAPMTLLRPLIQLFDKLLPEPPVTPGLLDLLALNILAQNNAADMLLGRQPRTFGENLAYAREVTAGGFLAITFGRRDRRGEGVVDAGP